MLDAAPNDGGRVLLSKSAYAKLRDRSPARVTQWKEEGRLVLVGKLVDVAASDALIAKTHDPTRGGKGGGPTPVDEPYESPDPENVSVSEIKRQRELIKLRDDMDELVGRAGVVRSTESAFLAVKERLLNMGPALGSRVAAESNVRRCIDLITAEARAVLDDLADALALRGK